MLRNLLKDTNVHALRASVLVKFLNHVFSGVMFLKVLKSLILLKIFLGKDVSLLFSYILLFLSSFIILLIFFNDKRLSGNY